MIENPPNNYKIRSSNVLQIWFTTSRYGQEWHEIKQIFIREFLIFCKSLLYQPFVSFDSLVDQWKIRQSFAPSRGWTFSSISVTFSFTSIFWASPLSASCHVLEYNSNIYLHYLRMSCKHYFFLKSFLYFYLTAKETRDFNTDIFAKSILNTAKFFFSFLQNSVR